MTIRRIAYETLLRITEDGAYANLALKDAAAGLDRRDVSFLFALVYTALDHRAYVEYVLSHYCKRQKKTVRTVLLLAGSELLYLSTPAHAVINEAVSLTKALGKSASSGLVNAVLRRMDRDRDNLPPLPTDPIERLCIQYGYPAFLISEWVAQYGYGNTERLLGAKPTDLQIRAQYPFTTEKLKKALPVSFSIGALDPNCLHVSNGFDVTQNELFRSGKLTVQNEGAMLICRSLGAVKGKRVLDACAAPGGKTAYLASLCENDVELVAWELHPHRKELMDKTFSRLHVSAQTECRDASVLCSEAVEQFDAVLLDVPCSGFGLLADKPDLRYRKTDADMVSLLAVQKQILSVCSRYVKPGGTLVYATCTISRRENDEQVRSFLAEHPEFELLEEKQYLPYADGIDGFYHATMKRG